MLTRIITGLVMVAILAISLFGLPKIVTALMFSAMAAVAAYELLYRTGLVRHKRLVGYSMLMAFLVPLWCYAGRDYVGALLGILLFTAALFGEMIAANTKLAFGETAYCYVAGLLLPFLLGSLARIHDSEMGKFYVVIPFVVAFLSDTGAYFSGRFFGKHKLAPVISPKKTVEGMIGGVIIAMLGMVVYALILEHGFHFSVNYMNALIYGLVGSFAAVFGDLCFSVIKRQTGVKDYGNLFPGHGGILDRFDSMMIVGPLVEAMLLLLPVVV